MLVRPTARKAQKIENFLALGETKTTTAKNWNDNGLDLYNQCERHKYHVRTCRTMAYRCEPEITMRIINEICANNAYAIRARALCLLSADKYYILRQQTGSKPICNCCELFVSPGARWVGRWVADETVLRLHNCLHVVEYSAIEIARSCLLQSHTW